MVRIRETTVVYIERQDSVLMLHRIRKDHDVNHGKWIGVGGKMETGESPEECMRREVYEETGLLVDQYRYCGVVTFSSDEEDYEYMHLFLVTGFHGSLKECDEGDLQWLPKSELTHIPHWAGDRIFLSLIFAERPVPFFSLKMSYKSGVLTEAVLNEHCCIVTDRLILRPWLERDAAALFEAAKNPAVGPAAGWPPHRSEEESLRVIREVLSRPEIYAIVLRDTSEPVGAVGLQNFRITDASGVMLTGFDERQSTNPTCCTMTEEETTEAMLVRSGRGKPPQQTPAEGPDGVRCAASETGGTLQAAAEAEGALQAAEGAGSTLHAAGEEPGGPLFFEAELGYWLAEPFWGQGYMQEAGRAVMRHGFEDLGLRRIWCRYYEGNERSERCMKKLGFHFHHTDRHVYLEQLQEYRDEISCVSCADNQEKR